MIGLDTPILLRLLRGESSARSLLKSLQGEELATTEWNFLELEALARLDTSAGKERRRSALERLRRRLTVIPLDDRGTESFLGSGRSVRDARELVTAAILSALESRRCAEWITTQAVTVSGGRGRIKVRLVR